MSSGFSVVTPPPKKIGATPIKAHCFITISQSQSQPRLGSTILKFREFSFSIDSGSGVGVSLFCGVEHLFRGEEDFESGGEAAEEAGGAAAATALSASASQ